MLFFSDFNFPSKKLSAQQRLSRRRSESPAPSKLLLTPDTSRRPSNSSLENEPPEEHCDVNDGIEIMTDQEDVDEDEDINVED